MIDIDNIREVWIKGHYRALILPIKGTNIAIVSLDVFSRKWKFNIDEEAKINDVKLVYAKFKPKELGLGNTANPIEKIEIIGAIGGDFKQTISARLWIRIVKDDLLEKDIQIIHSKLMEIIQ